METEKPAQGKGGILSWVISVTGWLVCAGMCLALTIALESWPYAYDMFLPAVLFILFCNIIVFLFITTRQGYAPARLFESVCRVCIGEAIILAGFYALGRYAIGF